MPPTGTRSANPALARARTGTTLLFLANGAGFGAWAGSVAATKEQLAASDAALGAALLCTAFGAMLAMPLAGLLGARRTPRLLSAVTLLFAATLPLPAFAPNVPALAAALLALGAGAGSMDVSMNARATRVQADLRRPVMSSFHAAFALGGLLGAAIVAAAQLLALGPAPGLLAISALLLLTAALHARLDPRPALAAADSRIARPSRAAAAIGLLCACAFLTEGGVADWSAVYLRASAAVSPAAAVSGFAAFEAAMVLGRLTGDAAIARFGPTAILRLGALAAAAGIALACAVPKLAPLGFALVGLGGANVAPILFTAAGAQGPAGLATVATLGYGGMLLGPPLIGGAAELAGLRLALLLPALAMLAVAAAPVVRPRA